MKFVFDIDGTICFDGHTLSDEIRAVLATAGDYGHQVIFATARSYRDCLGILGEELKNHLVIALNGGVAYQDGHVLAEKNIDSASYKALIHWCEEANLPYFVDGNFHYAVVRPDKIPFISTVDPLKKAEQRSWQELEHPIKMVIYMGDHEELVEDLMRDIEALQTVYFSYHEEEKCFYIQPEDVHKATAVEALCGNDIIAFGNDKNDKELFKHALYAIQIGNYQPLSRYADEQLELKGDYQAAIAARIVALFKEFEGK